MEDYIINLIAKARDCNQAVDGDYIGDDGFIYCHKCNTPKQCKVKFYFGEMTVPCVCECRAKQIEADTEARKNAAFRDRINDNRMEAFADKRTNTMTFQNADGDNADVMARIKLYADNFTPEAGDNNGLLLFGTVGTGKTFAAACVANALLDRGYTVKMTNFAAIRNIVSGFGNRQDYYDSLNRFQLLILDDIETEADTSYMKEIVYSVINSRTQAGLPLVVTSNLSSYELQHPADIEKKRLYSRLLGACIPIEIKGKDRRVESLRKKLTDGKGGTV